MGAGDENVTPLPADGVQITAFGRVNLRSGPDITYDTVGQLESGDTAQAVARSNYNNDWLYIESDTVAGWLAYFTVHVYGNPDDLPVLVPDSVSGELVSPSELISANYTLHLHLRPALRSRVIGAVPFAAQITPLAISSDGRWLYISYDGLRGWAWTDLFDITDEQIIHIPRQSIDSVAPTVSPGS